MKLSDVMAAQGQDAQDTPPPTLKLSDVLAQAGNGAPSSTYRASDDMSLPERILASYGRGVAELGQGAKQLLLHAGDALGLADPETVKKYDRDVAEEAAMFDRDLGQRFVGKAGRFLGQAVTTLPIGGLEAVAGKSLLASAGRTAVQGAAAGALEPVADVRDAAGGQPGGEDYLAAKLWQMGVGAATGAGMNTALRGAGAALEAIAPKNVANLPFRLAAGKEVTRAAQEGAAPSPTRAFIDESDRLSSETGVPFTPGQATGSKGLTSLEQKIRQAPRTADAAFAHDNAATQALDNYITRILDRTSSVARSPEEAGDLARNAINKKIGDIEKMRSSVAADQYGAIRQLVNGKSIIQPENTRAALSDIATEYGDIATPGAEALTRFANKMAGTDLGNLNKLISMRSYLSRVAGGQAKISGDQVDRKIARDLLGAIDNDMDASADQLGGNVGTMLKAANQNYRNFSNQIDYIRQSPLGRLLGKDMQDTMTGGDYNTIPPEKLIERLKTMSPSEVSQTRTMMQDIAPDAWQAMKRRVIEDALEQARNAAPSQGANTLALQPTKFVRALNGHTAHGQAWAKSLFEPGEMDQIKDAFSAAMRLGDKTGYNFSGTASQMSENVEHAAKTSTTMLGLARNALAAVGSMLTSKRLSAAMADPKGRDALLRLQRLPAGSAKARQWTAYLDGLLNASDAHTHAADQESRSP